MAGRGGGHRGGDPEDGKDGGDADALACIGERSREGKLLCHQEKNV